jgi:hypothetical protein
VTNLGDTLEVQQTQTDIGGKSITTLRLGYEKDTQNTMSTKVTSFSGGFVKNSLIAERVLTVEYVPLMGAFQEVQLDCAVALPGVDSSK